MTTPIKQNSPDEELLWEVQTNASASQGAIYCNGVAISQWGSEVNLMIDLARHHNDALRKSKAGQVEEERKGIAVAGNHDCEYESENEDAMCKHCGLTSGEAIRYFEKSLGKPEAVADHAQAVLQNNRLRAAVVVLRKALVAATYPRCSCGANTSCDEPHRSNCEVFTLVTDSPENRALTAAPSVVAGVGEHAAGVSSLILSSLPPPPYEEQQ